MFEGTRGVGAAVPFPAGPVRIRLGIKGWKFLTQARIPQSPGCSGRALGCPHPLAQAQGKERSPGPGPAALFEVTTPSDPWKSWRGSKLQPCCPARPRCAHPQLISTSIFPFFPCIQHSVPFSCRSSAGIQQQEQEFLLCPCHCEALTGTNCSVGNTRVGSRWWGCTPSTEVIWDGGMEKIEAGSNCL